MLIMLCAEQKLDENLVPWERMFFYMPLMHSESRTNEEERKKHHLK